MILDTFATFDQFKIIVCNFDRLSPTPRIIAVLNDLRSVYYEDSAICDLKQSKNGTGTCPVELGTSPI